MERIGHYEISAELGRGSSGVVYQARDLRDGRSVALKTPHLASPPSASSAARLRGQIEILAMLDHPGIVELHDSGEHAGSPYMAMELLRGHDAARLVEGHVQMSLDQKTDIIVQVAAALEYLHAKQLVHRNLKLSHIRIEDGGRVKLIDFCVSCDLQATRGGHEAVLGTMSYLAPEQIRGLDVDGRCDLFLLGCVSYELLTQRKPFAADSMAATLYRLAHESPAPLDELRDTSHAWLEPVVTRCLEKAPDQRYATANDLVEALKTRSG